MMLPCNPLKGFFVEISSLILRGWDDKKRLNEYENGKI